MPDTIWSPVAEARQKYPGLNGWTDAQILKNLSDPAKFRSAFPQYRGLSDEAIKRNMSLLSQPSEPAPLQAEARTAGNYASEIARGAGRGVVDDLAGLYQTARHPLDTAAGLMQQTGESLAHGAKEFQDLKGIPIGQRLAATALSGLENAPMIGGLVERAETGGTHLASPESVGAAAEAMSAFGAPEGVVRGIGAASHIVPDVLKRTARTAAGTTPATVRGLVETAKAFNETETKRAATANSDYNKEFGKRILHNRKVAAADAARSQAHADSLVNGSRLMTGIKNLEAETRNTGNAKYEVVKQKVGDASIPRAPLAAEIEAIGEKWVRGSPEKIKEFDAITNPPRVNTPETVLADQTAQNLGYKNFATAISNPAIANTLSRVLPPEVYEKAAAGGETAMSWNDLQGLYEELGRKRYSGTLAPDVYQAVKAAQELIGKRMQTMATEHGALGDYFDAKNYWHDFMDTFHDNTGPSGSGSPVAQAFLAKDPLRISAIFLGKSGDRGIVMLRRYSPELADLAEDTRRSVAKGKAAPRITRREGGPAPPSTNPTFRKVGPEEIKAAHKEKLKGRERILSHVAMWRTIGPLFYFASDLMRGEVPSLGGTALATVAPAALQAGITQILTNPAVRDFLTRATPADVAQVPEDLRGDFPKIVKAAQDSGIKLSPALAALVGTGVAVGPKTRQLQQNADDYRQAAARR